VNYLLDVNALVALGLLDHTFHARVTAWIHRLALAETSAFLTCSITELGFVRVLSLAPQYGFTVLQARTLLVRLKKSKSARFNFIADDHDISRLPSWATSGRQTTDGHLAELARANGAMLATLDEKIRGAFLIPR
jgi:predicted nucleic acid-binding protein